jgi:hypothetical protein
MSFRSQLVDEVAGWSRMSVPRCTLFLGNVHATAEWHVKEVQCL